MLARNELWIVEDPPIDEPCDLLTIPELKQHVSHDLRLRDEELGLRSLLERPEALSNSWWRAEQVRTRRPPSRKGKRQHDVLRAA